MILGYFKKLVLSERFALVVSGVYSNYESLGGIDIFIGTVAYAGQLYMDFSGGMDIVLGISKILGIDLPENFHAPFFAKTVREFWQRWHITLGLWFKDYVMYPLQRSRALSRLGKKSRKLFNKKIGRKVPLYISMSVLWVALGIWHGGTAYYLVATGIIPLLLLLFSDLFQGVFSAITGILKINTDCFSWRLFQRIRTLCAICLGWAFICAASVEKGILILLHSAKHLLSHNFSKILEFSNLEIKDIGIILIGVAFIVINDYFQENNTEIILFNNKQNALFRYTAIYAETFMILLYGIIGASFIYFRF